MHEHAPAVRTCLGARQELLELVLTEAPTEAAGDEDGLSFVGHARRLELLEDGRERVLPRVERHAGKRQLAGVDDDRRPRSRADQLGERRAGQREAEPVAHGGGRVDEVRGRRRWAEDDVVIAHRAHDDARAREKRNAAHPPGRYRCLVAPKTLTGEELQLDDAPAQDSELFLVDGNNLAYRGFFALPEELQTTDGQPTNALLGFTNMLFKLLSDYKPRGVAVAWDTRPVHRTELSAEYKSDRRPMPDLLREQFPHFRPIVEAFGYRNLEFEGWEADDVIATLATRADEAGIKTCVVSTDRDAFQLVSENVCLMMTPRGVADVQVYTPERVEARYGIRPDQIPDFIGLKGDTSDNIPGIPGIGDKTAGQLIAQYGSLAGVVEHVDELSPARSKSIAANAEQAEASKLLATMRRDLELDVDIADLVSRPPDRSQLKEIFRRFEFRSLLGRVDTLDEALPAAERPQAESEQVAWREGELPKLDGRVGVAVAGDRLAVAGGSGEVTVVELPSDNLSQGASSCRRWRGSR